MKAKFDVLADEIFLNRRIPRQIKTAVRDAAQLFRGRFQRRLGTVNQSRIYNLFKDELDEIHIAGTGRIENLIRRFRAQRFGIRDSFDDILDMMPEGAVLKKNIQLYNTGQELNAFDSERLFKSLEERITAKEILDINVSSIDEQVLRSYDRVFKTSRNPLLRTRAFMDEAEMNLAAKGFLGGSPNILRVSTIAGMLGLGIGGFKAFGPIGGIAGIALALNITNPRSIARMLVLLEKANRRGIVKPVLKRMLGTRRLRRVRGRVPPPERQQAILNALITRALGARGGE
jgi:hypothetical protein